MISRKLKMIFIIVRKTKPEILNIAYLILILMDKYHFFRTLINKKLFFIIKSLYIISISFPKLYIFLEMKYLDLIIYFII